MYGSIATSAGATSCVLLCALAATAINPSAAAAQHCGWDARELENGRPRVLSLLLSRDPASTVPADALAKFMEWVAACDATAARTATMKLRAAADRNRSDDLINAVYGIMLARGPEVQLEGSTGYLFRAVVPNSNAEKEATRRLAGVAERTGWPEAAEELAALALATRNGTALREAARILAELAPEDPSLWILLAETEIVRANYEAARSAASAAHAAGSPGARRTLGIVNLFSPDSAATGSHQYLAGMAGADDITLQKYYDDLVPLLTAAEIEVWNSLDAARRPAWLRRAWEWRSSISTLPLAERLATHFARIEYAFQAYRRQSFRAAAGAAMWIDSGLPPLPLDDRGIVFIRHGEPDDLARYMAAWSYDRRGGRTGPAVNRTAWFYRNLAGGRAILEFDKSASRPDYFLADPSRECEMRAPGDASYRSRLAEWRPAHKLQSAYDCTYATVAGDTTRRYWSSIQLASVTAEAILQTESAEPTLRKPIDLMVNAYALKAGFDTEVTTFIWAQAAGIIPTIDSEGVIYRLPLFLALEDASSHSVMRMDTSLLIRRDARFGERDAISIMHTFRPSLKGEIAIRVALRNEADSQQGQIALTRRSVREYRHGFSISDLVIAEPRSGNWRRGDTGFAPLPAHMVGENEPFRLFYEVYGLEADEPIDVEILVVPAGTSGLLNALRDLVSRRHAVALSFHDNAHVDGDGSVRLWHDIQAELTPGSYTVVVRVTRSSGVTAESSSTLDVL